MISVENPVNTVVLKVFKFVFIFDENDVIIRLKQRRK